jgi:hypothetical protein
MALAAPKLKIKTPSSLKEISLYTSPDDMITPLEPFSVRVGGSTLYASLYPPKSITGNNVYIYTKNKKYRIKEDNTVPIPAAWTGYNVPFGEVGDIAAGNGMFMYVGHGQILTSSQEFRCYTSANGVNWTEKTAPLPPVSTTREPHLAFHHNHFYFTYGSDLVYSINGSTWTKFTPLGIKDGNVHNMWVNYWNQKFAYYVGESQYDAGYECLVGEDADITGSIGNKIINANDLRFVGAKTIFWGKHFYTTGVDNFYPEIARIIHFDSTNNGRQPSFNMLSIAAKIFPFGPRLYIGGLETTNGYDFSPATGRPDIFNSASDAVLVKGEDIAKRMAIFSVYNSGQNSYTWYAYDHMAPTAPIAILTSENPIKNVVSVNGIYVALDGAAVTTVEKLWTASFL